MKPHKHAELIKAWADGAEIQYRPNANYDWVDKEEPLWFEEYQYRIKPEEKKPVVRWLWAWNNLQSWTLTDFYTEDELIQ